jgi:hypothetical protein
MSQQKELLREIARVINEVVPIGWTGIGVC